MSWVKELLFKALVPISLTIMAVVELIITGSYDNTFLLWILYGVYKFIVWASTD